jgi:hypothetical protein
MVKLVNQINDDRYYIQDIGFIFRKLLIRLAFS